MADIVTDEPVRQGASPRGDRSRGTVRRAHRNLVLRVGLIVLGAIVLIVGGTVWWLSGGRYVTTDDAYVQANVLNVTTDVSGLVEEVLVREGQSVDRGEVLFRLDPTAFQLAADEARANLEQTELQLRSLRADYATAEKQAAAQQAKVDADQATFARYADLVVHQAVSREQFDNARYQLASDQAALQASQATALSALARLGGTANAAVETMPTYKLAAARLAEAERNQRHSVVRAAFAGQVTQTSKLQPGQFLAAGTPAFGLVDTHTMWIAAEPKETDLSYVRVGQPATITIDAWPGHVWHGVLRSTAPATDQQFSVLPAQNSSGNWVKVVQRIPLRVEIHSGPNDPPLSAGTSAEVAIDTGHRRSLGDLF
jgi:membrane fusion protein, multidrug efflux system